MKIESITLMEAYIIENLRKHGISNDELVNIDEQAIKHWKALEERFDFTMLENLAKKSKDKFSSIIYGGYRVKFLTINGLINLIELKLEKTRDTDFTVHEDGISRLVVDATELKQVQQLLSPNWQVVEEDKTISIRSIA